MGKFSKSKGARGERELASVLREHGYSDAKRSAQYCGKGGESADVIGAMEGIHIECKRTEKLQLWPSLYQAKRDAKPGNIPAVFHRPNHEKWIVIMYLDDFMPIYREWHSGQVLEGK